jgi:hypothetical protein
MKSADLYSDLQFYNALASDYHTHYRALLRSQLTRFLSEAGFSKIEWQIPADSGYYQPIIREHKQ